MENGLCDFLACCDYSRRLCTLKRKKPKKLKKN